MSENENIEQSEEQILNPAEQPRMFTEKEIRTIAMEEAEKKDRRNQRILQGILLMVIAILLGFTIVFFLLNVEMLAANGMILGGTNKIDGARNLVKAIQNTGFLSKGM